MVAHVPAGSRHGIRRVVLPSRRLGAIQGKISASPGDGPCPPAGKIRSVKSRSEDRKIEDGGSRLEGSFLPRGRRTIFAVDPRSSIFYPQLLYWRGRRRYFSKIAAADLEVSASPSLAFLAGSGLLA